VRHHMVDHGRRHHAPLAPACGAQGLLRQEGSPCLAPARPVASACRARPPRGPAPASPPPRSAPLPDGARAASRATAAPQKRNPPRPCRAGSSPRIEGRAAPAPRLRLPSF
jgi:hypothetical protein